MNTLEALIQLNLELQMECADLADLPTYPLPPGYVLHWYEPGDEQRWLTIHTATEKHIPITLELFWQQFGNDSQLLSERLFFLLDPAGVAIATTAAWFVDAPTGSVGLIHWVAIKPEYQGRGLSNVLMSIACARMVQLGHQSARLTTGSARIPALNLYLKFGFRPSGFAKTGENVWRELQKHLKAP